MNIKVQMGMVLNLDKCLACHTCSIPCKNAWTTAPGTEYMWFNNVETKPGVGYPKEWENQDRYKGGWEIRDGKLHLRAGGKTDKLANIFANPDLPALDDELVVTVKRDDTFFIPNGRSKLYLNDKLMIISHSKKNPDTEVPDSNTPSEPAS